MATNWTSITSLSGMLTQANTNTGGYFWAGMLFLFFVVTMVTMLGFGLEVAVFASAFTAFLVGLILVYMGLVSWTYVAGLFGIILALIIWISYARNKDY
jgi:hypothetical protein